MLLYMSFCVGQIYKWMFTECFLYCSAIQLDGDGGYVTAALGNTWSHSVNTRLILQYLTDLERQVMVAKSPIAPFTVFTYTIQQSGLVQKEGGAGHYAGTDPGKQKIKVKSALGMDALTRSTGPDQG
ncbi:DNA repair protein RAD51-like 2 [Mizuhopecten yessoensis]|uniref:DNA repair protein RAD51-like 2 n=1 Tax=Mizuhopecten yessoensis TaxID=6573 RepID=A0A210PQD1_MIZYE|nr:DNA repair protein RAD51-like 2 [Mizuhopecten yessoensis]